MKNVKANTRNFVITEEHLERKINIGLENDKQEIRSTTQKVIQTAVHPITRQYTVYHLGIHIEILAEKWYVDWISPVTKSLAQNTGDFFL